MEERAFKGVWIPAEIWLNNELTIAEKALFAEIDSLDGENGCFASNEYLAKFCNTSESFITKAISKLKKMGYIKTESFDGRTRVLRVVKFTTLNSKSCESDPDKNEFLLYIENKKENNIKRASEPRLSSPKHSRNFQKETKQLTDKLSSGAEIAEQEEKKKKKRSQKELCLDEIEDSKYQFSNAEKVKLTEYLEWAMSGKDNRRIRNVELWRTKLNTLLQLREEGCDLVKVIQNSIEKKWYVFVDEKQEHGKKNGGYRPVLDDKIIIDHAFDTKEKVQAEMQRRKDAGIPSFQ